MANTATRTPTVPFLPPAMVAAMKRTVWAMAGMIVVAVAVAAMVAMASYHPGDPSWNTATDAAAHNWLAEPGAVFADAMLQALGLAALVPVLTLAAWGGRVMRAETVSWLWLRTVLLPAAVLFLAIGLSGLSLPAGWPLPTGLGGFSGHMLLDFVTLKLSGLGAAESVRWLMTAIGLIGGLTLFPLDLDRPRVCVRHGDRMAAARSLVRGLLADGSHQSHPDRKGRAGCKQNRGQTGPPWPRTY